MKKCNICLKLLEFTCFNRDSTVKDGHENGCRACRSERRKKNYRKNLSENREKSRLKSLEWRKNNKGYQRKFDLKRTYGLTTDDYNKMLESQDNKCFICLSDSPRNKHNVFVVDHCHKTGRVRGLLCTYCNLGLGAFSDNIESLNNAINYLTKSN